ncbi:hypothetical protein [Aphanothece sacrum]|uniref:hypothetical protein n=1 Tax=Aphanothece sacrum TaxID=1122 RepID=UPI000F6113D3|nr:hypothetical protein [Aphanothece sacrum]
MLRGKSFYREVKRVLKPKGIIAIWCYGLLEIPHASDSLNVALQEFYDQIESCWPPERQLIDTQYQTISFPFSDIPTPNYSMTHDWTVKQLIGYFTTWSATQKYIKIHGEDNLLTLMTEISNKWSLTTQIMTINWPLFLRVGQNVII